jgi:hypothetical protein
MQEFKNRQLAAEKLFREGTEFLNKFKEQLLPGHLAHFELTREVRLGLGSY